MKGVKNEATLWYSGREREVVEVQFVMGVFTFYFVDLQSTKLTHHKNIILLVCTYCTLFATIANLESQYYLTYVNIGFVIIRQLYRVCSNLSYIYVDIQSLNTRYVVGTLKAIDKTLISF